MSDCVDPTAVSAEELAAYALDPVADARITQHLAVCPACAKEVAAMQALNQQLTQRLSRYDCPPATAIEAYAAQALPLAERVIVARHIQQCQRCAEEVAFATEFLSQSDPLLDWKAPSALARLRRVLASLQSARSGAPAMALRGAVTNAPLTYVAEDVTLTLRYVAGQTPRLLGFIDVMSDPAVIEQPIAVRLLAAATNGAPADPSPVAQGAAEDGAFDLAPISPGAYALEVDLPDRQIVIEQIALG